MDEEFVNMTEGSNKRSKRPSERGENPLVSVVIPTYNRPQKLSRAVQSVLDQTYENWGLVVVNDHPEHDVRDRLPDHDAIEYIHHEKNRGAPITRNDGIRASSGRYVALLDDDDAWKPSKLSRQVARFESLDDTYGIVYTGRDIVRGEEVIKTYTPEHEGWLLETLLERNVIPSETPLIRRECLDTVGLFDPNFQSCQDIDLWLRIAKEYKIAAVRQSLAIAYRGHDDRISQNMERKFQGHERLLRKHESVFRGNRSAYAKKCKQIGYYAAMSGRDWIAAKYFLRSYRSNPRDMATPLYAGACLLPDTYKAKFFELKDRLSRAIASG